MSNPDLSRPDVCPIHAAAEQAAFAEAARGVPGADRSSSADDDLPVPGRHRRIPRHRLRPVLNAALTSTPHRFRYPIRQPDAAGARLAAGNRGQGTGQDDDRIRGGRRRRPYERGEQH
jgi:hypothetical protein